MEEKPWTKEELSLRVGFPELAKAVVKQWILDGKPKSDREEILYWIELIKLYQEE